MESKLAQYAEQQLVESARRLSPEQRLVAFVAHCQAVNALYRAATQAREATDTAKPPVSL